MKINRNTPLRVINLLMVSLVLTSCNLVTLEEPMSDSEIFEPTTRPSSISEINEALHGGSNKTWSCASFTLAGLDGFQSCRLDDKITMNIGGGYTYNGGSSLCGAEDSEQNRTGTWEVIADGSMILFDEGTDREYTASLNGIDQNNLSISGDYIGLAIKGIYNFK